ncbi:trimeric LpxA-like protein [Lipomyces chichibuensis]|uniref:trimeric LpxA-like protein n=1 Tax=Lipomyces chichibuensis TaxID=1546026 RepID=UPI003343F2E3
MIDAKPTSFISEHVVLDATQNIILKVGDHSIVHPRVRIGTQPTSRSNDSEKPSLVEIGDYTIISDRCSIEVAQISPVVIGNYTYIDPGARVEAGVTVGDFCILGAGCVIGRKSRIGNSCRIAAGAKIGTSTIIPPRSVVVGDAGEIQDAGEDMSDEQQKREMKMHVDFLMRVMPLYNKPRQDRK